MSDGNATHKNNFLLKLFVKDGEEVENVKVRTRIGKVSGLVGIMVNILLAISKMIVGIIVSSVSIIADALNNLTDAASSIVTLIGFKLSEKPADKEHPYGHARFEYLSGLAVAVMMLVIGLELIKSSIEKIIHPSAVDMNIITGVILVIAIIAKLWLAWFNRILGKAINSGTLIATAQDSRNDVIMTSAVLVAGIIEKVTGFKIDGLMGLLVAIFIIISGVELVKTTISPLLGEGANDEMRDFIVSHVMGCEKVLGCHDLMVHDYGPGKRFASIHVEMDKDENNVVCHELIDELERSCYDKSGVNLVIHYDPIVTNDEQLEKMKKLVLAILRMKDERISVHDFRMVEGKENTNLIFDMVLPMELIESKDKIKESLDEALNDLDDITYYTVITFDEIAFN
jgi:cation diffusion facilitator family transporter